MLLRVIDEREIEISDRDREFIESLQDMAVLELLVERALESLSAQELFAVAPSSSLRVRPTTAA
jgi:DNA-binding winged helix-turn-helix (wHTH) protein